MNSLSNVWSGRLLAAGSRLLWVVVGAVVTLIITQFGAQLLSLVEGRSPSLGEQLDTITHEASNEGYGIVWHNYVAGLHAGTERSLVLILADKRNFETEQDYQSRPEEVRIYDITQEHGHSMLIERFHFRPTPTAEVGFRTSWRFYIQRISDLTHEGEMSIVGYFTENRADESTERPVLIYWDDQSEKYNMISLIPTAPALVPIADPGLRTVGYVHEYREEETLRDSATGLAVPTYATSAFAVRGNYNGINTLAAFFASVGGPGKPVVELANFQISLFYKTPHPECESSAVWRLPNLFHSLSEHDLIAEAHHVNLAEC